MQNAIFLFRVLHLRPKGTELYDAFGKIEAGKVLEGAIRHFAQSSKYIVFIFSGSNRNLLTDIFADRSRPLYALCDWISLHRIERNLYEAYINKIAEKTWNESLLQEVMNLILQITERHPEEVYTLCANLWQYSKQMNKKPEPEDVELVWKRHLKDRLKQTRLILSSINPSQMKLLILIANGLNKMLTGKVIQQKLNLTSPSIVNALHSLESLDLIEKNDEGIYRILDPTIKDTLIEYYSEYLD